MADHETTAGGVALLCRYFMATNRAKLRKTVHAFLISARQYDFRNH